MPRARWPACRPITVTKNQRSVVAASCMRLRTSSLPRLQAVVKPNVMMSLGSGRSLSMVLGTCATVRPSDGLGQSRGRKRGVVAADGDEVVDAEALEGLGHPGDAFRRPRRIRARGANDRAAVEVDAGGVVDLQLDDVLDVALHQPLEAVVAAQHAQPVVARLDRGCRDDRVDARRGTTTYEDRQRLHDALRPTIVREGEHAGQQTPGAMTASTSYTVGCPRRGQRDAISPWARSRSARPRPGAGGGRWAA